ncbi:hypothetical protein EXN66_Car021759 [Channa argus]|uniref:Uncharacterized protein n=1 Tax=Channa argus TaxID=215402 RepID=A0A6G1QV23_CHAAH|nr:hypothetical protein EXN66_Car021759 [Channa argus]
MFILWKQRKSLGENLQLKQIPAVTGQKAGNSLDRSPAHLRVNIERHGTLSHMHWNPEILRTLSGVCVCENTKVGVRHS